MNFLFCLRKGLLYCREICGGFAVVNKLVFWKGAQFIGVMGGFVAAFWLLFNQFGAINLYGFSYGSLIAMVMLPLFLLVSHVFVAGMFKEMQDNAERRLKTGFELEKVGALPVASAPLSPKEELAKLKQDVEHLKHVKKLLAKARMEGKLNERDFNSYGDAATKKMIDAETRMKEIETGA